MARLARLVIPDLPHHVTQRGNRRGRTFFEEGDYALYLDLLSASAARAQARAEVWCYCLMPTGGQEIHSERLPTELIVRESCGA